MLRGIAGGKTNGEIAAELYISEVTVKSHVNHLFAKIGARSRAEAVRYAYEHGLTKDKAHEPKVANAAPGDRVAHTPGTRTGPPRRHERSIAASIASSASPSSPLTGAGPRFATPRNRRPPNSQTMHAYTVPLTSGLVQMTLSSPSSGSRR